MKISPEELKLAKNAVAVIVSASASAVLISNIHSVFTTPISNFLNLFSSQSTIIVEEFTPDSVNYMFEAVNIYLCEKLSHATDRIRVHQSKNEKEIAFTIGLNQNMIDIFQGEKFSWILVCELDGKSISDYSTFDTRYFEVRCKRKNTQMLLRSYLQYIGDVARTIRKERYKVKLHTIHYNSAYYWSSVNLDSPMTFDSIAMDAETKALLIKDLERFRGRSEYYRRVGKVWKRNYLIYGPSGTGKSSLVAAMANHLKFDLHSMSLSEIDSYSCLRSLLISAAAKSIVNIDDMGSSVELEPVDDDSTVTLSGVLKIIDWIGSSCGDGRIIVITTKKDINNLVPDLLRPGLIDMQIQMSYCTFSGFKTLAKNYLNIEADALFEDIEKLLNVMEVTPAEVACELLKYDAADLALKGLVELLSNKTKDGNLDVD